MILFACGRGDKIILPRNVHRSVINALILCGAVPVYVNPHTHERLGIALGMSVPEVEAAVKANPDAKAIFVNNPTYYGICSDITSIAKIAHDHGMLLIADEAHGTHFCFGEGLPPAAIKAGADIAAVSMHKSGGSLTQSSFLLTGANVNANRIRQIINLTQTTSGSYLLMASLDVSRKNLALRGKEIYAKVVENADYARHEINRIGDYYAYSDEIVNGDTVFAFDKTKLSVNTLEIGLAGVEVYDILRDEYDIQTEFGDLANFLAYLSAGDRLRDIERLVSALAEIRRIYKRSKLGMLRQEYISPRVVLPPQEAFYSNSVSLPVRETAGKICSEFVMCYPPGIPILAPGEEITPDIIEYIIYSKEKGATLTGTEDPEVSRINVID